MKKIALFTILTLFSLILVVSVVQVSAAETTDYLPSTLSKLEDLPSDYLYIDDVWFPVVYPEFDHITNERADFAIDNAEYVFSYDISETSIYDEWASWILQLSDLNPTLTFQVGWMFGIENDAELTLDEFEWISSGNDYEYTGSLSNNTLSLVASHQAVISEEIFSTAAGIDIVYGGNGNIFFKECVISITAQPQSYDNDVYYENLQADYSQLPLSENVFLDVFDWTVVDADTNTYELILVTDNHPDALLSEQYNQFYWYFKVTLDPDLDYSEMKTRQIKYVTNDNQDRILLFDLESDELGLQIQTVNDIDTPARVYRSTYTVNLTQGETYKYEDFAINAVVNKGSNSIAYLNLYLPMQVEELLSLSMKITYRIDELFATNEPWVEEERFYEAGSLTEINPPSWVFWLGSPILYGALDATDIYNMDTIQKVDSFDTDTNDFARETLQLSNDTILYSNKYKITLGQFSTLTSIGYDISKVALVNMIYESQGIYYDVSTDLLENNTNIVIDESENNLLSRIEDGIDSLFDGDNDLSNDNPSFFDEINNTSKILFTGLVVVLTFVLIIKIVEKKRR